MTYSAEEARLLNDSARMRLAAHGIEVRSFSSVHRDGLADELRHTSDESDCPACRARIATYRGRRGSAEWHQFADQGLRLHAKGHDQ